MKTTVVNNDPNYTYKITNGISTIKGGVCIKTIELSTGNN